MTTPRWSALRRRPAIGLMIAGLLAALAGLSKLLDRPQESSPPTPGSPESALDRSGDDQPRRPLSHVPGNPIPAAQIEETLRSQSKYTNESLHTFLERERRDMGIKKILSQGEAARLDESPASRRPRKSEMTQKQRETRAWMEGMSTEIGRQLDARTVAPVELSGEKPVLLSNPDASSPTAGGPIQLSSESASSSKKSH
ncbi:MAG: hypothetical protein HY551_07550 [Elusimicrobia bacterium]|nr:hypothetical protein [Elusimicrobiota bacterium]